MDKKIKCKYIIICILSLLAVIILFVCCQDNPHNGDYYYNPSNSSFGKIEEGTIRDDGTFVMEPLIYPIIKEFDDYDDYFLAKQIPNVDEFLETNQIIDTNLLDSATKHHIDSVNILLNEIKEIPECYWIVQKSTKKVYGPLTKNEYHRLIKQLDVKKKVKGTRIRVYRMYL